MKLDNPSLKQKDSLLSFYDHCIYLGTHIELKGNTMDINRQLRKCYAKVNLLILKFGKCSADVKCQLFKSYCANLYCSHCHGLRGRTGAVAAKTNNFKRVFFPVGASWQFH